MSIIHEGFHAQDGWYFRRLDEGGVEILDTRGTRTLKLDANGWVSVMASMSASGETAETFQGARDFHLAEHPVTAGLSPHARRELDALAQVRGPQWAEAILISHQRHRGGCLCGWSELGKSHPGHQVAKLREVGLLTQVETDTTP
jgi:hypothetical protein